MPRLKSRMSKCSPQVPIFKTKKGRAPTSVILVIFSHRQILLRNPFQLSRKPSQILTWNQELFMCQPSDPLIHLFENFHLKVGGGQVGGGSVRIYLCAVGIAGTTRQDPSEVQQRNILHIKSTILYNKRLHSGIKLSELTSIEDKIEFFHDLLEHISQLKASQISPILINLHPESIVRSGNVQIILTDFFIPLNQISTELNGKGSWYLSQQSPEQLQRGICTKQSLVWQLGCLLYYIKIEKWPFLPNPRQKGQHGLIGVIRRSIILQNYLKYSNDDYNDLISSEVLIEDPQQRIQIEDFIDRIKGLMLNQKPNNQQIGSDSGKRQKQLQSNLYDHEVEEGIVEDDEYCSEDDTQLQQHSQSMFQSQIQNQKQKKAEDLLSNNTNANKIEIESQKLGVSSLKYQSQLKESQKFEIQNYKSEDKSQDFQIQELSPGDYGGDYGYSSNKKDQTSLQSSNLKDLKSQPLSNQSSQNHKLKVSKKTQNEPEELHFDLPEEDDTHQISQVPSFDNLPSSRHSGYQSSRRPSQLDQNSQYMDQSQQKISQYQKSKKQSEKPVASGYNTNQKSVKNAQGFDDLESLQESEVASRHNQTESSFDMAQSYRIKVISQDQPGIGKLDANMLKELEKQTYTQQNKQQPQFKTGKLNIDDQSQKSSAKSFRPRNSQGIKSNLKSSQIKKADSQYQMSQLSARNKVNEHDIPISFVKSERNSERSINNQSRMSQSQLHDEFGCDQSSISQNQETDPNSDCIGFVVGLTESQALGISIEKAEFILFTFENKNNKGQSQDIQIKQRPSNLENIRQVISLISVIPNQRYIVVSTETTVNIFQLDYQYKVQIQFMKQMKIQADSICASFEEPSFFIAKANKVGKAFIDPEKESKVYISSKKLQFYQTDQVKVSAMCYTEMKEEDSDYEVRGSSNRNSTVLVDGFLAIATEDFHFIILKINGKQGKQELIVHLENIHESTITQVLPLTDFTSLLSFVTLSYDTTIHIISQDGEQEYHFGANGQVINGIVIPSRQKDHFIVSAFNEEVEQNEISVYRKDKLQFQVNEKFDKGHFIFDFKLVGNKLFLPVQNKVIRRYELEGF
ncbi:UNKNOWN [Stylonychia lemnae]|uniref:Protein kinase domain containing protein n=1 Tax=Stylonychia lemnae TaxID=5949 RepID=A0A078A9X9_STYLE|nr:UNKNOWN [Stylonychia lemnae]|eukprot:CDW78994.1 UNKNOWN [Stylonychia lemnae]